MLQPQSRLDRLNRLLPTQRFPAPLLKVNDPSSSSSLVTFRSIFHLSQSLDAVPLTGTDATNGFLLRRFRPGSEKQPAPHEVVHAADGVVSRCVNREDADPLNDCLEEGGLERS
jgi:hypothetical protein